MPLAFALAFGIGVVMTTMPAPLPHDRFAGPEGSPAALLVHGFPFDRRMWKHVAPALGRRRTVICPDLRGFGHASSLPAPRSLDEHADDLARTLDALAIERASLVGLSMGGYIALAFAERHRDRLLQLALVDSRAAADSEAGKQSRKQSMAIVSAQGVTALYQGLEMRLFAPGPLPPALDLMRAIATSQGRNGVLAALAAMRDRPDRTAVWEALDIPTLCVVGEHDTLVPPSEMEELARSAKNGQFVELKNAGHLPNVEVPEKLVNELDMFLLGVR